MQEELSQLGYFEITGVIFALLYVLLAIKEIRLCWLAAIISSLAYVPTFFFAGLYTETALQFFFVAAGAYGFTEWKKVRSSEIKIRKISLSNNAASIIIALSASILLGTALKYYSNASFPYLDSIIGCFSISSTILQAKKYLENWIYWILIDLIAFYVYIQKTLFLTASLYLIFIILAILGYLEWHKQIVKNND